MFGFVFGALPCLLRFCGGAAGVLRIAKIVCAELFAQRGFLGIERGEGFLGLALAARELRELVERALLRADRGLECRNAAGFVVFARVELLFERGGRFTERLTLFARGDERGDAALKLGARVDRQAALADERAPACRASAIVTMGRSGSCPPARRAPAAESRRASREETREASTCRTHSALL